MTAKAKLLFAELFHSLLSLDDELNLASVIIYLCPKIVAIRCLDMDKVRMDMTFMKSTTFFLGRFALVPFNPNP